MANHYIAHVFKTDGWETLDSYWNSPFSYWARKGMRVEPVVPLRVKVLGSVQDESEEGFINYGGPMAMFIQTVQARARPGQHIRVEISDDPIEEIPEDR